MDNVVASPLAYSIPVHRRVNKKVNILERAEDFG